MSASPDFAVPSAAFNHVKNGTLPNAGIFSQSASKNTNGQLAAIQPIVPHNRTKPKSFCGSLTFANAMLLVREIVGTEHRQCRYMKASSGQELFGPARASIAMPPMSWLPARKRSAAKL